ncbi:MAG: M23 family metallopeptidase [Janthinobacterium lividum]
MRALRPERVASCPRVASASIALSVALLITLSVVSSSNLGIAVGSVARALPVAAGDIAAQRTALARMPARYVAVTTLAHGEDIGAALRRLGFADTALQRALRRDARAGPSRALGTVGAGDDIQLHYDERRRLRALVVQLEDPAPAPGAVAASPGSFAGPMANAVAGVRRIAVERAASGRFTVSESFHPYDVYWRSRSGVIGTGFFTSMARAGVPGQIVAGTLRLFRDRIDFRHGFRPGDAFRLIHEQLASDMGSPRPGRILAVELQARGSWHRAIWHRPAHGPDMRWRDDGPAAPAMPTTLPALAGEGRYLTFEGAPLHGETAWQMPVRASTAGARISSAFGMRIHPLSGYSRHHQGIDLAAPRGTPVVAAADGTIVFAGWRNGYGRLLVVRHAPPYSTYYAHLDGFAPGIRAGRPVARGEPLGRVGSTGDATGPHLHFELRAADRPVDPTLALRQSTPTPTLHGDALRAFRHDARPLLAQIARLRTLPTDRES